MPASPRPRQRSLPDRRRQSRRAQRSHWRLLSTEPMKARRRVAVSVGYLSIGECPTPGSNSTLAPGTAAYSAAEADRHLRSSLPKITSSGLLRAVRAGGGGGVVREAG